HSPMGPTRQCVRLGPAGSCTETWSVTTRTMVSVARSRLRFATSSKGAGTVPERGTGMRTVVAVVVSVLLSALISTMITHHVVKEHARQEVTGTAVESFNDGFQDGACSNGEDGYGHPCLSR